MRRASIKSRKPFWICLEDNSFASQAKLSAEIDTSEPGISTGEPAVIQRIQAMLPDEQVSFAIDRQQTISALVMIMMEMTSDLGRPFRMRRRKAYSKRRRAQVRMNRYPKRSLGELMDSFLIDKKGRIF